MAQIKFLKIFRGPSSKFLAHGEPHACAWQHNFSSQPTEMTAKSFFFLWFWALCWRFFRNYCKLDCIGKKSSNIPSNGKFATQMQIAARFSLFQASVCQISVNFCCWRLVFALWGIGKAGHWFWAHFLRFMDNFGTFWGQTAESGVSRTAKK